MSAVISQNLTPDIWDAYLSNAGTSDDWTTWNPNGAYVTNVAANADQMGAVPMFTLYQMATKGDSNLSGLSDATFMAAYWANVKLMYQKLGEYNKPALVNFEPDFWGYVQMQATSGDPTKMFAYVKTNADCASLPNDVTGVARCLVSMARQYAPKTYVGFPPSEWAATSAAQVISFMNAIGADTADFIVMQTLDRDAGCFEVSPQPTNCGRTGSGWYWSNSDFTEHLTMAKQYHDGINGLPLLWWQTPQGVPSSAPGGSVGHYRDNRTQYFLTHASELVAAGALGVVFGAGEANQTTIKTDGGHFQSLSTAYFNAPAALP